MQVFRRTARSRGRGQTLIELIAATTIIATTLVPALRMMRNSLNVSREIEMANHMSTLCVSKLEEQLCRTGAVWDNSNATGDFSADGYPNLKYIVTRSDSPSAGGITDSLMAITVTVWDDKNNNNLQNTREPGVTYATKVARLAGYLNAANGT